MPKQLFVLAALVVAAPALAQSGTPAPAPSSAAPAQQQELSPPPEFMAAAQAFGMCVGAKTRALPGTGTPQATAHQALAGCTAEKAALETRFEAWVSSPGFPAAGRDMARQQFREQMNGLETRVAEQIQQVRAQRATPGAAPAPAPSPTATGRR